MWFFGCCTEAMLCLCIFTTAEHGELLESGRWKVTALHTYKSTAIFLFLLIEKQADCLPRSQFLNSCTINSQKQGGWHKSFGLLLHY